MTSRLEWFGDAIVGKIERSARRQTTRTVDRAVELAKQEAPVDTGEYRDEIRRENEGLDVRWGGHSDHSIWIEIGAQGRPANPVLRRAADRAYPGLAPAIAKDWPRG